MPVIASPRRTMSPRLCLGDHRQLPAVVVGSLAGFLSRVAGKDGGSAVLKRGEGERWSGGEWGASLWVADVGCCGWVRKRFPASG